MGAISAGCSTVRRWTRSCGPGGSAKLESRLPPGSSSYKLKRSGWGGGVVRNLAVYFISLSSSPALAIFGPLGAARCFISARAIATVIRSCRSHERSRRCRRLIAALAACSSLPRNDHVKSISKKVTQKPGQRLSVDFVVVVVDGSHQKECLRQQSPMNCAREPSMAKNSSPSRAPKNGAQLQTTWRSAKHASKPPKTPSHRHMTASKNNVQIFKCETAGRHPSRPSRRKN